MDGPFNPAYRERRHGFGESAAAAQCGSVGQHCTRSASPRITVTSSTLARGSKSLPSWPPSTGSTGVSTRPVGNWRSAEQQYELAQAQLERARRLVDAGQRSQVEIIRAEAGVAEQLQAIIVAENSLRDRERELKRVLHKAGLDIQTPTIVVPTTQPDPVRYDLDRSQLVSARHCEPDGTAGTATATASGCQHDRFRPQPDTASGQSRLHVQHQRYGREPR